MIHSLSVFVTTEMFEDIRSRGNMSDYIRTLILTNMDAYGNLDDQREITGGVKRTQNVLFTVNNAVKEKIEKKASQYGLDWKEYARRLILQVLVDRKLRRTSGSNAFKDLMKALDVFIEKEDDALLVVPARALKEAMEAKEKKNRYIRLIPEIQRLMSEGVSIDDVLSTAEIMKEKLNETDRCEQTV